MNHERVILNVRMEAVAGREQELERRLAALITPTRAESGCISYELHRSREKPGMFMFCETFASQEALDEHIGSPHFQAFAQCRKENDPVATVDVSRWTKID